MKVEVIQDALTAEGLDGWLFYDHHRRDPLAYRILGLNDDLQPTRRWYYFIPAIGEPRALCHRIESHNLDVLPGAKHFYSRWSEQRDQLRSMLENAHVIAMQYSAECALPYIAMVDAGTIELVRTLGVEIRGSANLVQLFEARWSEQQIALHLEAGRRMDRIRAEAFALISERVRSGADLNEWQVRSFLLDRFCNEDLQTDHGPIVAVDANASDPHYEPSPTRHSSIRPGNLVLIDMWAKLKEPGAVYYDITWTGVCGEPSPEMQNVFAVVTGARDAAIRFVQQSIAAKKEIRGLDVDDIARGHIRQKGFEDYFIHRTGHSIGEDVHGAGANMDNFETHDDRRIIPQTCFSIEPGVYLPNFGIRSEVNMLIGEHEARVTGEVQTELLTL
jgi:Xaa-Pro aminopeptidase